MPKKITQTEDIELPKKITQTEDIELPKKITQMEDIELLKKRSKSTQEILGKLLSFFLMITVLAIGIMIWKRAETLITVSSNSIISTSNWGLGFGREGTKPSGNETPKKMQEYNAYYVAEGEEPVLYLTFDCGYENGNTDPILDALKKHNAHATFFVVGHFQETSPGLLRRIVQEGHLVGNHTYHHPDMSKIATKEAFAKEMIENEALFKQITGYDMQKYYRPPQGKYNTVNLKMANEMGYSTFFWSLAYVDWKQDDQPTHEEAFSKLLTRVHPGAIVLLHNTSSTNAEILDELLTEWEKMGYRFGTLDQLLKKAEEKQTENSNAEISLL